MNTQPTKTPPTQWFVSIEGEQKGPLTGKEIRRWVAGVGGLKVVGLGAVGWWATGFNGRCGVGFGVGNLLNPSMARLSATQSPSIISKNSAKVIHPPPYAGFRREKCPVPCCNEKATLPK